VTRTAGLPRGRAVRARTPALRRRALGTAALPTLEEIARLAATDSLVRASVERAATHLADALLPAVQLLDPEIVMIGGPTADALDATFRRVVERHVVSNDMSSSGNLGPAGPAIELARPGAGGASDAARRLLHETFTPAIDHLVLEAVAVLPDRPPGMGEENP
jgi:predicted NBD/HSP70 family sugar kinase